MSRLTFEILTETIRSNRRLGLVMHAGIGLVTFAIIKDRSMGLLKEFKTFIVKGNAIDMAVGIIIGAAFGLVVKSLVDDIMMPPLGYVMGGIDFSSKVIELAPGLKVGDTHPITQLAVEKDVPAVVIRYGVFINAMITLFIQGFAIFMVVKAINTLKRNEAAAPAPPAAPPADVQLLTEIRDLLKRN